MLSNVMDGRCYAFTLLLTITTVSCSHHPNQALSQASEAANPSHDSANKSHVAVNKAQDSANQSHEAVNKAQDSANKTLDSANQSHDLANQALNLANQTFDSPVEASSIRHRVKRDGILYDVNAQELLNIHNDVRRRQRMSNMRKMMWSDYLAQMAKEIVRRCVYGGPVPWSVPENMSVLVNYMADIEQKGFLHVIDHLLLEEKDFDYATHQCKPNKTCENFQMMITPGIQFLGCSYSYCDEVVNFGPKAYFYVCSYGRQWNHDSSMRSLEEDFFVTRFRNGSACATCIVHQWCDEGLCVDSCSGLGNKCKCGSECQNCGTAVRHNCSCTCQPGYFGPDCSERCNNSEFCSETIADRCRMNSFLRSICPKTCGNCNGGDKQGGGGSEAEPKEPPKQKRGGPEDEEPTYTDPPGPPQGECQDRSPECNPSLEDKCNDPVGRYSYNNCPVQCGICEEGPQQTNCNPDRLEKAFDLGRGDSMFSPLTLKLNLLIESVLLLSLHNYL